ncbi:MAG TPA: diaminobutyrate acetyltransferase [Ruania sp.]|nr:diaminobutyrate acetyltransferase [Ruania sp.]
MPTPTESETPHTATAGTTANSAPADGGPDPATSAAAPLLIRTPERGDGAAMWTLARDGGELDLNSSYAYVLMAKEFAATCRVALSDGEVVGFLLGFRPPERPGSFFVWQVAVRGDQRGRSVAKRMLNDVVDTSPDLEAVEATVEESNTASRALFASFARSRGAELTWSDGILAADFPDGHNAEPQLRISPLTRS